MKPLLIILSTILSIHAVGQSTFVVDGLSVKVGSVTCKYQFGVDFRDTLKLILMDSVITYSNPEKTIIKTEEYSVNRDVPSVRIEYLTNDGKDSIVELFRGDVLNSVFTFDYDSLGRRSRFSLNNLKESSSGFESIYNYKDSLISTGKISIQTIETNSAYRYRVYTEFDSNGRKINEYHGDSMNDPFAEKISYLYDELDELVGEVLLSSEEGIDTLWYNQPRKIDLCNNEFKLDYISRDLNKMKTKLRELVSKHETVIKSGDCPAHSYLYKSEDELFKVTIGDTEQFWRGFSRVEVVLDF
jgi:hypothetical protein